MNPLRPQALSLYPPSPRAQRTAQVKWLAAQHGLKVSSVTTAEPFPELGEHLELHIDAGHVAGLDWFTHERARFSTDVRNLHPTAVSILSVGLTYWPGPSDRPDDGVRRGRISRYAWGRDYHRVLKRRMKALLGALEREFGHTIDARLLVDTARVMDRAIAARAGLGWYGKHTCLIVPGHGSWVMLGELVLDLDLEPDAPLDRNCGKCTICIDNCPTGAIVEPYTVHTPSCISYLTIEHRGTIPHELRPKMGDWVYGCDVCQEVCPYTRAAEPEADPELRPAGINNAYPSLHWLLQMTEAEFGETYFGTAVPRTKRRGLARNAAIALGNTGDDTDVPVLALALASHDEPLVRAHVAWALGRIGGPGSRQALERARAAESVSAVHEEIDLSLSTLP
jgi:epoxyqueuosine reductase